MPAADRWNTLSREGAPQSREDIEKRLAELDAEDAAENEAENARDGEQDEVTMNFNPNHGKMGSSQAEEKGVEKAMATKKNPSHEPGSTDRCLSAERSGYRMQTLGPYRLHKGAVRNFKIAYPQSKVNTENE